jgi:hypothetical protein
MFPMTWTPIWYCFLAGVGGDTVSRRIREETTHPSTVPVTVFGSKKSSDDALTFVQLPEVPKTSSLAPFRRAPITFADRIRGAFLSLRNHRSETTVAYDINPMITGYNRCMRNIRVKYRSVKGVEYKVVQAESADEELVRSIFLKEVPNSFVVGMEDLGEAVLPVPEPVFKKPPKAVEDPKP